MAATVRDIMDPEPATVRPDTPVEEVVSTLRDIPHYINLFGGTIFLEPLAGHNRLPVVEDGRLVGVVTRVDVLGALAA
jgi:CBS domain-containing protein